MRNFKDFTIKKTDIKFGFPFSLLAIETPKCYEAGIRGIWRGEKSNHKNFTYELSKEIGKPSDVILFDMHAVFRQSSVHSTRVDSYNFLYDKDSKELFQTAHVEHVRVAKSFHFIFHTSSIIILDAIVDTYLDNNGKF